MAVAPSVVVTTGAVLRAGVEVTFSVASGGGSVTEAVDTTDASGIATVGGWTLGLGAGANTLVATTGAVGDSVTFSATGVTAAITFQSVSANLSHSCGVTTAGAAYCWGSNFFGMLGDGTLTDSNVPVAVLGVP